MSSTADLMVFFTLVLGVVALPGMDMAFVASSALTGGLKRGMTAVGGIVIAGALLMLFAATGIDLLATIPRAFDLLLVASGTYMAWIGFSVMRAPAKTAGSTLRDTPSITIFRRAMLTCLLNPKAYAFTLAVLPAFIRNAHVPIVVQVVRLGLIIAATQIGVYGAVAVFSASARSRVKASPIILSWMPRVVGVLLISGSLYIFCSAWQSLADAAPSLPPTKESPMSQTPADSSHDFDFLIGHWTIHNQKLLHIFEHSDKWESFDADVRVFNLPGGIGNYDEYHAEAWRPGYVGATIRVFNPTANLWNIYSLNNRGNGFDDATLAMVPPVQGRFVGDHADFDGPDTFRGKPIVVRYRWNRPDETHCTWEQLFSTDGGATWEANWRMQLTKQPGA